MEIINLNSLLRGLDKILHRLIGEDIEVLTDLDESLECVRADHGQIEQVIMNLAVNARDAMPSGGKLVFATSNVELSDSYPHRHPEMLPGRYALLSVTDTGAGMSREVRERVFEPFFTTKEKGKGTGLGLSTVYGIIKQSEGYIWVDSKPGMGTTFQIYLGSVGDVTEEAEHRSQVEEASRGDETILLVEDDEGVRGLAREILQNSGYRIVESSGGEEAAEFYRESREPIHLILTDVVMPRLSGRELVNQLRPLRPETRVLYMSGYTDNSIVSQGALEKGIHYIQKPFTMEGLTRMVRETIDCA
jgi:two-component system cell cycle sensor histidine kinase/response regulator CckA